MEGEKEGGSEEWGKEVERAEARACSGRISREEKSEKGTTGKFLKYP
jgi:hypothetical protein